MSIVDTDDPKLFRQALHHILNPQVRPAGEHILDVPYKRQAIAWVLLNRAHYAEQLSQGWRP